MLLNVNKVRNAPQTCINHRKTILPTPYRIPTEQFATLGSSKIFAYNDIAL